MVGAEPQAGIIRQNQQSQELGPSDGTKLTFPLGDRSSGVMSSGVALLIEYSTKVQQPDGASINVLCPTQASDLKLQVQ